MVRSLFMPQTIKIPFVIMLLAVILGAGAAQAKSRHIKHHKVHHPSSLVDRDATYADIVIDAESGRILHASSPDSLRHPASLTKMMTLYLTFQALESGRLQNNQYLPISGNAAEQSPSKLGLHAGQRIKVEDAILGLVTESANDAAVVIAEWLGGSEQGFGQLMTRQARALGMTHTRFDNPSGLPDPDQVTTARDMAVLGAALIYHFPQFYPYFSHDDFTYAGIYHHNHNHLMDRYDGMDGIKTGYIRASGFNLVASAKRGDTRLIGVVFGGHSATARDNRMAQLLDQAFADDEKGSTRFVSAPYTAKNNLDMPQGDGGDSDEASDYVKLPSKGVSIAMVSPPVRNIAPPKANVITSGNWGIQIGAYGDPAIGRAALANIVSGMPQLLGSADPVVQKVSSGSVTMYRARLMALDQKTAQAACAYLVQQRQSCLTVGP